MFGYLLPCGNKMSMEERLIWQKNHCGICMSFKKYGNFAKLCANYDFTFLNIFLHSYFEKCQETKSRHCLFAKLSKVDFFVPDEISDEIAKKGIILLWFMHLDNSLDKERNSDKILGNAVLKKAYKKCEKEDAQLVESLKEQLLVQVELEKNNETDLHKISTPTGNMLKTVVGSLTNNDKIVSSLFFYVGQWIYLMDAIDDLKKDHKKKKFNPLLIGKNFQGDKLQFIKMNESTIYPVLFDIANNIKKFFYKLPKSKQNGICKNVLIDSIQSFLEMVFKR